MKSKEIKLVEIKKHNPTLHSKVMSGSVKLQDAYNEVMSDITNTKEFKGRGTKSNKITFDQELEIIQKRYKPTLDDWLEQIKKLFPFTHQDKLK
tara:strand:- start:887 stop:1168 length:282 start_codon:yes stop_codon:yes gene_type:complete